MRERSNRSTMKTASVLPYQSQREKTPQLNYIERIKQQVSFIENSNRELLSIGDQIKRSHPMAIQKGLLPMIQKIQLEIDSRWAGLAQNIKQCCMDIDLRLKSVAMMINQEYEGRNRQNSDDSKYEFLANKIQNLQQSLRQTQLNEQKLVKVIESLMQKYQVNDEPTLIRNSPDLQDQFKKNRLNSSANQIKNNTLPSQTIHNKTEYNNQSIYEHLYPIIDESIVSESMNKNQHFRLRQIQEQPHNDQVYIKRLYSKYPLPVPLDSKKSLKIPNYCQVKGIVKNQDVSQVTAEDDKEHRLNFMIGKLNI